MDGDAILDTAALDKLYEWGGAELKDKMIELFSQNAPDRLEGVRAGLGSGDLELAERSAHSLKSSAANLGAQAVRQLSGRIEELLEKGEEDEARGLLPELEEKFGETIQALGTIGRQSQSQS